MDFLPKELIKSFNQQEMKLILVNGSIINMIGSDSVDSVVGSAAMGIVVSEAALADKRGLSLLRPMTTASNGFFLAISTPRSHNHFYDLYNTTKNLDDWYVSYLTIEDTKHIPIERIEKDIESGIISRELAQQEYYCSWSSVNSGAYFAKTLDKMVANNQVTNVPYDPALSTYVFVDLGISDMFTMSWMQLTPTAIHIIDFYESHSEPLVHYVNVMKNKNYGRTQMWIPHDGRVRELATGVSRFEILQSLDVDVNIVDRIPVSMGIEAIRTALPKTYIDKTKCKKLVNSIENYSREYDDKLNAYKERPRHDIHSHRMDSLRYAFSTYKKLGDNSSPEELDARYRNAMHGGTIQTLDSDFF